MAIDEGQIVDAVVNMGIQGNEEGIIDAFNVYLTNHYVDYFNRVSYRLEEQIQGYKPNYLPFVLPLLVRAGYACGIHTYSGIKNSDAWKSLIEPQCENKEDEIRGLVAVVNALGFGVWEIVSVQESELVVRSYNTYESEGYLHEFGKRDTPGCFLALGGLVGMMNVVYGNGELSEDLSEAKYMGEETHCRSKGDEYCEFVVTPQKGE